MAVEWTISVITSFTAEVYTATIISMNATLVSITVYRS